MLGRYSSIVVLMAASALGAPTNSAPNPYRTVTGWFQIPAGRAWGSTAGVDIDSKGHIWVAERCGTNSCADSKLDPIFEFDASGKLLRNFGGGMFVFPHGIGLDKDGNVWVTDGQGKDNKGHQVFKFSPEGKLMMTLGKAGVTGSGPDTFNMPSDVAIAPNGNIFIGDGHGGTSNNRVVKFSKDGKYIKQWGTKGTGPGEFDQPHALAFDSKGRLFVGDRNNNRIQIFDQDGKFIEEWAQFSRPSGIFIDKHDTIYVADSESESVSKNHDGWKRGIRVGSAKTGEVKYFLPDPAEKATGTSAAEGVAADTKGNIYGAEVGPKDLKKYIQK
ncbi:MAG: peptidyl-alpha-hydroxyglycine alpha-amidating lyase family protein [Bryobacteraceae bacterium]